MARTVITATDMAKIKMVGDTPTTKVATTIDAALVTAGVAIDAGLDSKVLIKVINSFAGAKILYLQSHISDNEDWSNSFAQDAEKMFVVETARFEAQSGTDRGLLLIDFEAGFTGSIEVYAMPK